MAFTWLNLAMQLACGLAAGPALARVVGVRPPVWREGAAPVARSAGAPWAAWPALAAPNRRRRPVVAGEERREAYRLPVCPAHRGL